MTYIGLPWWLRPKESACNVGDPDLIPRWERSAGKGKSNPLQYSCPKRIPRTEERWQQFPGSQRVGHDQASEHHMIHYYLVSDSHLTTL